MTDSKYFTTNKKGNVERSVLPRPRCTGRRVHAVLMMRFAYRRDLRAESRAEQREEGEEEGSREEGHRRYDRRQGRQVGFIYYLFDLFFLVAIMAGDVYVTNVSLCFAF